MQNPINISYVTLSPCEVVNRVFDMTGRCGFAVCLSGDLDVRIMNTELRVTSSCVLFGMPFITIEILRIKETSELIVGTTTPDDVMSIVNRTIASNNLLAISRYPMVKADARQLSEIKSTVDEYLEEIALSADDTTANCRNINQVIMEARSDLIVARLLKVYFTNIPMNVIAHNHYDILFQNFMLDLYANFRKNRNVRFYAERSGMSLKYFSTIVRELTGNTPSQWIETMVVGEAKALLDDPSLSIKEIAALLNFPDASTFSKYFSRLTSISPRKYRRTL